MYAFEKEVFLYRWRLLKQPLLSDGVYVSSY